MIGSKSKGLFIDFVGGSILAARTTGTQVPFVVEEWREIPLAKSEEAADAIRSMAGVRGNGFASCRCAVYPANRIISKIPVEGRKLREEGYLAEHVRATLKIDPSVHQLCALSPVDGSDINLAKTAPKEMLVCGAPIEALATLQDELLAMGIYPEALELGSVASLGGMVDYMGFSDQKSPVLQLEVGNETTQVFVVSREGVEITRTVAFGISAMIPVVQKELGLKDEESARKLFFSNSFDFTGMGPQLTKRLLRELQASIGFYEVQTGQSITTLCCTQLPAKIGWLEASLADVLGMRAIKFDIKGWLGGKGIGFADESALTNLGPSWTGLLCLMGEYKGAQNEAAA